MPKPFLINVQELLSAQTMFYSGIQLRYGDIQTRSDLSKWTADERAEFFFLFPDFPRTLSGDEAEEGGPYVNWLSSSSSSPSSFSPIHNAIATVEDATLEDLQSAVSSAAVVPDPTSDSEAQNRTRPTRRMRGGIGPSKDPVPVSSPNLPPPSAKTVPLLSLKDGVDHHTVPPGQRKDVRFFLNTAGRQ